MGGLDDTKADHLASHRLAYLHRTNRRQIDEDAARIERELGKIKSDAVLSENGIPHCLTETIRLPLWLSRHDEPSGKLEQAVVL